jgi:hypothetical protein
MVQQVAFDQHQLKFFLVPSQNNSTARCKEYDLSFLNPGAALVGVIESVVVFGIVLAYPYPIAQLAEETDQTLRSQVVAYATWQQPTAWFLLLSVRRGLLLRTEMRKFCFTIEPRMSAMGTIFDSVSTQCGRMNQPLLH